MVTGKAPFESESVKKTLSKIKDKLLNFPENQISPELLDLLKHTINWEEKNRYNVDQILKHPFFQKSEKRVLKETDLNTQSHKSLMK